MRRGNRFMVTNRNRAVARLVAMQEGRPQSLEEKLAQLASQGPITYEGTKRRFKSRLTKFKPVALGRNLAPQDVIEDRR